MPPGTQGGGGGRPEHEQQEWAHPPPLLTRQNDPMITISNEMSNGSHSQGKVNGKEALNVILNFKVITIQMFFFMSCSRLQFEIDVLNYLY